MKQPQEYAADFAERVESMIAQQIEPAVLRAPNVAPLLPSLKEQALAIEDANQEGLQRFTLRGVEVDWETAHEEFSGAVARFLHEVWMEHRFALSPLGRKQVADLREDVDASLEVSVPSREDEAADLKIRAAKEGF